MPFCGACPNGHAIRDALDLVGLPYKDKKLFSQYSLGMKQRLAIALAIMHDPELLILDEPINGLDPIGIAEVRSFIRELCDTGGKTILISSHILSEISLLADDIGIIDHGTLLEEESLARLEQKSGGMSVLRFPTPPRPQGSWSAASMKPVSPSRMTTGCSSTILICRSEKL